MSSHFTASPLLRNRWLKPIDTAKTPCAAVLASTLTILTHYLTQCTQECEVVICLIVNNSSILTIPFRGKFPQVRSFRKGSPRGEQVIESFAMVVGRVSKSVSVWLHFHMSDWSHPSHKSHALMGHIGPMGRMGLIVLSGLGWIRTSLETRPTRAGRCRPPVQTGFPHPAGTSAAHSGYAPGSSHSHLSNPERPR